MRTRSCLLPLAFASPVLAEPSPAPDTVVVTGQPLTAAAGTPAYGAVTITRDRLASDASGRLEDVLRDVAGFQEFRRTDSRAANPTSQGVTLRALGGNASSRALVLLDGVPQADPFAGYIPFSAIAPERLAAARVTRGGGVGAFGAGAVAGTIELESAGADALPLANAQAFGGSRGSSELAAGIAPELGRGFLTLDARWDRGDGYILIPPGQRGPVDVPARYDSESVGLRAVTPVGANAELQVRGLGFDDHRLRGEAGTASESRGEDASARLIVRGRWQLDALAYVQDRDFASGFVSTSADRTAATPSLDQFKTPALGLGGRVELRPPELVTGMDVRVGGDARGSEGRTNELFRFQNGFLTRLRRAGGSELTAGVYGEADAALGRLTLTGGVRVDRWRIADGSIVERDLATGAPTLAQNYANRAGYEPSLRGGALWRLGDFRLRAAAYTGFRLPTLNELYRPFRVGNDAVAANPMLGLEKLRGVEGGAEWYPATDAKLTITLYRNVLDGAVANVTLGQGPGLFGSLGFVAGSYAMRDNVRAIRVTGVESEAETRIGPVRLSASAAWSDARVAADGVAAALNGLRPAQTPMWAASGTADCAITRTAGLSATIRYTGRQAEDDLNTRSLPPATTVDAVAHVTLRRGLELVGRVENLFDVRVVSGVSAAGVEDLGTPRTLWLGVRAQVGR